MANDICELDTISVELEKRARSKPMEVRKQEIHTQYQSILTEILQSTTEEELDQYAQSFSALKLSLAAIKARNKVLLPPTHGIRIPRNKNIDS